MSTLIPREDLLRTDFADVTTGETLEPVSPGEMLDEEFLKPLGMSKYRLAKAIDVPPRWAAYCSTSSSRSTRMCFGASMPRRTCEPLMATVISEPMTMDSLRRRDATTRKAIAELEAGKGKRFVSVDDLMADLPADD